MYHFKTLAEDAAYRASEKIEQAEAAEQAAGKKRQRDQRVAASMEKFRAKVDRRAKQIVAERRRRFSTGRKVSKPTASASVKHRWAAAVSRAKLRHPGAAAAVSAANKANPGLRAEMLAEVNRDRQA